MKLHRFRSVLVLFAMLLFKSANFGQTGASVDKVRHCSQFSGATAGARIAAAIRDLPSTGGTVNCRGLEGNQTISQNVFSGFTKPVRLLLGNATYSVSVAQVLEVGGSSIEGVSADESAGTILRATSPIGAILAVQDLSGAFSEGIHISNMFLDCNKISATGLNVRKNHISRYDNLYAKGCATAGFDFQDELYDIETNTLRATENAIGVRVRSGINGYSSDKINFINLHAFRNRNQNVLLDGSGGAAIHNVNFLGGSFELGTAGIEISVATNVNIYGGHFESNSVADIYAYKPGPASTSPAVRSLVVDGSFFHGNNMGPAAIVCKGCIDSSFRNIYSELHTNTGTGGADSVITFDNSGLSNITNYGNTLETPLISEKAGFLNSLTKRDGLRVINYGQLGSNGEPRYYLFDQDLSLNAAKHTDEDFSATRSLIFSPGPPAAGNLPSVSAEIRYSRPSFSREPGTLGFYTKDTGGSLNLNFRITDDRHLEASANSHFVFTGPAPDTAGTLKFSGAMSTTRNFNVPWKAAPACVVTPKADPGSGLRWWVTTSKTQLTVAASATTTLDFDFVCIGNPD